MTLANRMKRAGRAAGVPHATAHGLRHVFATDLLVAGTPHAVVAALLGHRGIGMVVRVYDRTRERIDVLRGAILKARPA